MTDSKIQLGFGSADDLEIQAFKDSERFAKALPGGYVKKIVWDKEGGYPEHAWGFAQYSPRPFRQGYGCDGTTDANIHLVALTLCGRIGLDYTALYKKAYPDADNAESWLSALAKNEGLLLETLIPEIAGVDEFKLALSDLYQVNNRSLSSELEDALEEMGISVAEWWNDESRLRAWKEEAWKNEEGEDGPRP
jgi:hypothetical protein